MRQVMSLDLRGGLAVKFEIGSGACKLLELSDEALKGLRTQWLPAMQVNPKP